MRKPLERCPLFATKMRRACRGDRTATGCETNTGSLRNFVDKGQKLFAHYGFCSMAVSMAPHARRLLHPDVVISGKEVE